MEEEYTLVDLLKVHIELTDNLLRLLENIPYIALRYHLRGKFLLGSRIIRYPITFHPADQEIRDYVINVLPRLGFSVEDTGLDTFRISIANG
jgi:hypothetical protein